MRLSGADVNHLGRVRRRQPLGASLCVKRVDVNHPGFRPPSDLGNDGTMPNRYDHKSRAEAVRLVKDHVEDYETEWAAMWAVSTRLGMSTETLRKWVRQFDVGSGGSVGV